MPTPSIHWPTPRLIALEGLSGAGKTTISKALADALNAVWIDEAYWRLRPRPSLDFSNDVELLRIEETLLAEEFRRYSDCRRELRQHRSVVLDTDLLGPLTYVWGLAELGRVGPGILPRLLAAYRRGLTNQSWAPPDLTIYLKVSEEAARSRQSRSPVRHPVRWRARHLEVGRLEKRLYRRILAPVFASRWQEISAQGTATMVTRRLVHRLDRPQGRLPSASVLGGRLLDAIATASPPESVARMLPETRGVSSNR